MQINCEDRLHELIETTHDRQPRQRRSASIGIVLKITKRRADPETVPSRCTDIELSDTFADFSVPRGRNGRAVRRLVTRLILIGMEFPTGFLNQRRHCQPRTDRSIIPPPSYSPRSRIETAPSTITRLSAVYLRPGVSNVSQFSRHKHEGVRIARN